MSDDVDLDDVSDKLDRLDDVYNKLNDIEQAIKNQPQQWGNWIFWAVVFWFLVPPLFSDMWHSKASYSVQYDVTYDEVTIDKEPYDCNFLHAPIGGKGCHYERLIATTEVRSNRWEGQDISYDDGKNWLLHAKNGNGDPIVSTDDGKTWSVSTDSEKVAPSVSVYWHKEDD
jgi:hypothetical protein